MQSFQIKKEKWHHSDYSIYENGKLVGEFLPENFKHGYRLNLKGKHYIMQKISIWKEEKELFLGDIKIGAFFPKSLKEETIIDIAGQGEYTVKKTNLWKGIRTIFKGEKAIGECISKDFKTSFSLADEASDDLIAATMLVSMQQNHSYVVFIAMLPIFITLWT